MIPDIETSREEAFGTAYKIALHHVTKQYQGSISHEFLVQEAQKELEKMQYKQDVTY
ncbi:hypothetical protein [Lentibacillus sediminis]|uniref:hypothetical protein n=1 Tax=Lentibacillus sediminis TaxID=1940529 RepID=UPI00130413D2|nr:hypothetical protein [Lentibacillus sediminis]